MSAFQIVHGNQSCAGHVFSFLLQAYGRAVPVYVPVYLVPALVVHRQHLMKRYTIYENATRMTYLVVNWE